MTERARQDFEPVTLGFVDRARRPLDYVGRDFKWFAANRAPAGIGWSLWGMLPQLLPHVRRNFGPRATSGRRDEPESFD